MDDLTPLAALDHAAIAALLRKEALLGGIDDMDCEDPALWVLWDETGQYMLGACHLLAAHLHRERGLEVVVLEAKGGVVHDWVMRHVAVTTLSADRLAEALATTDGLDVPVIDAIGGGTFGDRLRLYDGFDEYRVVHANGRDAAWFETIRTNFEARPVNDPAKTMPGLALALGEGFDLSEALETVIEGMEQPTRLRIPRLAELEVALSDRPKAPRP